jgi:hypothetical protein
MIPRIYTYKITFEEIPHYYYGVHKEKKFNEKYWGSPMTNKWYWNFYTPKKQILELFEYTNEGWLEAQQVEKRIIKEFFNKDEFCLNKNCGGIISTEILVKSSTGRTHQKGKLNSQYGKIWITDGTKDGSFRIHKDDSIPDGFVRGRFVSREQSFCIDCGNKNTYGYPRCDTCSRILQGSFRRKFEISKVELEKLINTQPIEQIGRMFGVSGNAIRKRCRLLGISNYRKST